MFSSFTHAIAWIRISFLFMASNTLLHGYITFCLSTHEKVKVLVSQLCLTLCDPVDCNPPGSSVHRILQARILELPCPPQGDLPTPGTEPRFPALQADSLPSEPPVNLPLPGESSQKRHSVPAWGACSSRILTFLRDASLPFLPFPHLFFFSFNWYDRMSLYNPMRCGINTCSLP